MKHTKRTISRDILRFSHLSMGVAARIVNILKKGDFVANQKQFASKMEKHESEISKWLTGNHNFTLKTIAKIEKALGEDILFTQFDIDKAKRHIEEAKNLQMESFVARKIAEYNVVGQNKINLSDIPIPVSENV